MVCVGAGGFAETHDWYIADIVYDYRPPGGAATSLRKSTLRTFPEALRGRSDTISMRSGVFCRATPRLRKCVSTEATSTLDPFFTIMNAQNRLPQTLVRYRQTTDSFNNPGVTCQEIFDFLRRNILATADNDVLLPIRNGEKTVCIHSANVTCAEPATGQESRRVHLFRPISQKQLGSCSCYFALRAPGNVVAIIVDQPQRHAAQQASVRISAFFQGNPMVDSMR